MLRIEAAIQARVDRELVERKDEHDKVVQKRVELYREQRTREAREEIDTECDRLVREAIDRFRQEMETSPRFIKAKEDVIVGQEEEAKENAVRQAEEAKRNEVPTSFELRFGFCLSQSSACFFFCD